MMTRALFLVTTVSLLTGCTQATKGQSPNAAVREAGTSLQQLQNIDPVLPQRDYTGKQPDQFQWTAVKGADHYAIGIFNEVDVILWRNDDVPTNSIAWPAGLKLDGGTYFWSVSALQGERTIGDSGRTAFVIMQ